MESWFELARQESNHSQYWPDFSIANNSANDPQLGKVFPIAYRFPNIKTARMYFYYWVSKIFLQCKLHLTYKAIRGQVSVCMEIKGHSVTNSGDDSCPCSHVLKTGVGNENTSCSTQSCNMATLPSCPDASTLWEHACSIAQSMEYCTSEEMGLLGSQVVVSLSPRPILLDMPTIESRLTYFVDDAITMRNWSLCPSSGSGTGMDSCYI